MDRPSCRHLVIAVALAFAGTGAFAHGTKHTTANDVTGTGTASTDSSVKGTSSADVATSADTGTTSSSSGAVGVQSTPSASDEDHNDEGAATRGKSVKAKHHHRKHETTTSATSSEAPSEIANDKSSSLTSGTNPNIQPENSNASPPASESKVVPSNATTR